MVAARRRLQQAGGDAAHSPYGDSLPSELLDVGGTPARRRPRVGLVVVPAAAVEPQSTAKTLFAEQPAAAGVTTGVDLPDVDAFISEAAGVAKWNALKFADKTTKPVPKELEEAVQELKSQDDTTSSEDRMQVALRVMALQSINDAGAGRGSANQYPNKAMPIEMQEKWEYGSSQTNVEEHITMLEDWLILAPPALHTGSTGSTVWPGGAIRSNRDIRDQCNYYGCARSCMCDCGTPTDMFVLSSDVTAVTTRRGF